MGHCYSDHSSISMVSTSVDYYMQLPPGGRGKNLYYKWQIYESFVLEQFKFKKCLSYQC
jgi:hypothetical protein